MLFLLMAASFFAQQTPPEAEATFRAETNVVMLPFRVERDKYFVTDLTREDIMLLEDGKPRDFSVFETPLVRRRTALDIVLLFDTTTLDPPRPGQVTVMWGKSGDPPPPASGRKPGVIRTNWDREATYEFARHWNDMLSRAALKSEGTAVRLSVYRFDHRQLQRLCPFTSDPAVLSRAIARLPEQIPANEAIPLTLGPGREAFKLVLWPSWPMEAILATLADSAPAPNALRMMAVFSEGNTATRRAIKGFYAPPQDVADRSLALGMTLYPVALDSRNIVEDFSKIHGRGVGIKRDLPIPFADFVGLAEMTGGRPFYPPVLNTDSLLEIIKALRSDGLSQYAAGFVPLSASSKLREHKLEVRLKSKSIGKLIGGMKEATY